MLESEIKEIFGSDYICHINNYDDGKSYKIMERNAKAYIEMYVFFDDEFSICFRDLSVLSGVRKNGIGTILINKCIACAKRLKITTINLFVKDGSWMRKWYERLGFEYTMVMEEDSSYVWMTKTIKL